ncbi:MICAL-like protein 2a [Pungitius pungitius]|uniref:MICAL-like protein 2a n=1 Tax=Pungitius pungitius TaxID=134920 RepID=UPI002E13BB13
MAAIKALEQWCKMQCDGYSDVAITNMTTSFKNGLAFCALIHKYRPDLIDYDSLREEDVFENNRLAFRVAEEKLGIPALLDAEDMVALRIPDRLSILTYVSQYYNYFKGRPPMGGVKRPAEGSKEEPSAVAKSFVSKGATETGSPSTPAARPPADVCRAQKALCTETTNRHGPLHSKCVSCKSPVHLVQRHFVEGKLYHRSCFKCSDCAGVLPSSAAAALRSGAARPNGATRAPPASRPSSSAAGPAPPPQAAWTASAHRTQAARRRFFQGAAEASPGHGRPATAGKGPADNDNNNNNKRPFTVRSAETGPAGDRAGPPSNEEPPRLKALNTKAQDPVWGQLKLKPVALGLKDADAFTEGRKSSTASSCVLDGTTRPPPHHPPAAAALPPVSFARFDAVHFQPGSQTPGAKKGKYLSPTNASRTEMRSPSVTSCHIPVEQIERDLKDVETGFARLEQEGVALETQLRRRGEEGEGDVLMDPLMVDWFNLIREKQLCARRESELVYLARTRALEQQQSSVEAELRGLLEKPGDLKSRDEQQREKKLMRRLMELVDGRNEMVEGLDEDRLREVEEDQQLNEMMQNLGVKRDKNKRKSSISKLFRRSKRRVE